jgi:hypothetical protein
MVTYTAKWGHFVSWITPYLTLYLSKIELAPCTIFVGLMVCEGVSSYFGIFVDGVRRNVMCNSSLSEILCAMASYPKRR